MDDELKRLFLNLQDAHKRASACSFMNIARGRDETDDQYAERRIRQDIVSTKAWQDLHDAECKYRTALALHTMGF